MIWLAAQHPDWVLGFQDETWWSRVARPGLHAWGEPGRPLRLVAQQVPADEAQALACYGLWLPERAETWLRFVDGRPVSAITIQFLDWCCANLAAAGKTALLLIWDQASWHLSTAVRRWIGSHNQQVKVTGEGVRILRCPLPSKSPWLNPIEPKWLHAKRRVMEPARLLSAAEVEERVYAAFDCQPEPHLTLPKEVA